MFKLNPLHALDFYKTGHKPQYPDGTEIVYSNFTARSNKHFQWKQAGTGYVVLWGLQGFIKEFLFEAWTNHFFELDKSVAVKAFKRRMKNAVGDIDVSHIEELHDLGYLPIEIKALPEGTLVPIGMAMFTIKNTNNKFFWLTNLLETVISTEMWKPITTATIAYEYQKLCLKHSTATCDNDDHVQFQCHDFSMRGIGGVHDAAKSGHLLSFVGTDTVPAIDYLEQYYGADSDTELVGCSVPATEHSVMCMGSKSERYVEHEGVWYDTHTDDVFARYENMKSVTKEHALAHQTGEAATVKRLLTEIYPTGIFSAVLDTWDFFKVLTDMLPNLKDIIMERDGKFVVRPDSGDPVQIICGMRMLTGVDHFAKSGRWFSSDDSTTGLLKAVKLAEERAFDGVTYLGIHYNLDGVSVSPAQVKGAIQLLWETFGGFTNDKGFKVLDEHIGLIYGDSITLERAEDILYRLGSKGFAASNVVFGVGSYTYQYITRDTFGMAIKATWGQINGEAVEIFKDPITDDGTKKSAKGLLTAYQDAGNGKLKCKDQCTEREEATGLYQTVFCDGVCFGFQTLGEIRKRLAYTL